MIVNIKEVINKVRYKYLVIIRYRQTLNSSYNLDSIDLRNEYVINYCYGEKLIYHL